MCNLGEGLYEKAIAEEQARQAIETEKLLNKMEIEMEKEKELEFKAKMGNKAKELIEAGLDEKLVKKIMSI